MKTMEKINERNKTILDADGYSQTIGLVRQRVRDIILDRRLSLQDQKSQVDKLFDEGIAAEKAYQAAQNKLMGASEDTAAGIRSAGFTVGHKVGNEWQAGAADGGSSEGHIQDDKPITREELQKMISEKAVAAFSGEDVRDELRRIMGIKVKPQIHTAGGFTVGRPGAKGDWEA